jgi:hypothetical protein
MTRLVVDADGHVRAARPWERNLPSHLRERGCASAGTRTRGTTSARSRTDGERLRWSASATPVSFEDFGKAATTRTSTCRFDPRAREGARLEGIDLAVVYLT